MSAIEMRKLMKAVQLNEYLVQAGQPLSDILALNVFEDLTEEGIENWKENDPDFEEDVLSDTEFQKIIKMSRFMASKISQSARASRPMSEEEADWIHEVWYDGGDAYESPEEILNSLLSTYKDQIKVAVALLNGKLPDLGYDLEY